MDNNNLLLLSDSLAKIRNLVNDKDVNNGIQDKEFMKLAQNMAEAARHANTCSGIFFSMYMGQKPIEKIMEEPKDNPNATQ